MAARRRRDASFRMGRRHVPPRRWVRPGFTLQAVLAFLSAALIWTGAAMVLEGLAGCALDLTPQGGRGPTSLGLVAGLIGGLWAVWREFLKERRQAGRSREH